MTEWINLPDNASHAFKCSKCGNMFSAEGLEGTCPTCGNHCDFSSCTSLDASDEEY